MRVYEECMSGFAWEMPDEKVKSSPFLVTSHIWHFQWENVDEIKALSLHVKPDSY